MHGGFPGAANPADEVRGHTRRRFSSSFPSACEVQKAISFLSIVLSQWMNDLPADTVIDGEVVALDESGRPDFHRLQHFTAEASRIRYFVFDLLVLNGAI
jgi:ATP-dependent DNA ligase